MPDLPAILGGTPAFPELMPIASPTLPPFRHISGPIEEILMTGRLTNFGRYSKELEVATAEYLGVEYVVAVTNGTLGLLLLLKVLDLEGEVIVPSFTFPAVISALVWNGLSPVFADIDLKSFNLDVDQVEERITSNTCAVLGVHTFGNPCDVSSLQAIAARFGLTLIFDAAHAFGASIGERRVGTFGTAEVFSLSATKILTAGEGGLIATSSREVRDGITLARNYGYLGGYDPCMPGLNGKMPEFCAVLGLASLEMLEENVVKRNQIASWYRRYLREIPGLVFQEIQTGMRSTFKDFAIVILENDFGLNRGELRDTLTAENIDTRQYFYPPAHLSEAFTDWGEHHGYSLPNTEYLADHILCLPIYSHMAQPEVQKVCDAIWRAHRFAGEIRHSRRNL